MSRKSRSSFTARLALAIGVACAALFLLIRQASVALASPGFCATCHVMRPQYVSYRRSAHDRATCVDCHAGKGCAGCHAAQASGDEPRGAVNAPDPGVHAIHARAGAASCRDCHRGMMHARMDGAPRVGADASCGDCHGQTELGEKSNRYRVRNPARPEGL